MRLNQNRQTPREIKFPHTLDHGMELIHDLSGNPRNYLHEVSIQRGDIKTTEMLVIANYRYLHGWTQGTKLYNLYIKRFPIFTEGQFKIMNL